ncbi:MAG: RdgB/HAM1 family non-canonical purine NTP pyrophosphatase [Marinirhabdus sp.]
MQLVFATHNKNKFEEVKKILPKNIRLLSLFDIGCIDDIPETAPTIAGNAMLKAHHIARRYAVNCFADDTGLQVNALNGAPGVYSARYAGKDPSANTALLLKNLEGKTDRTARFVTCIALKWGLNEMLFNGICEGTIIKKPRGTGGFGYDPVFLPKGYEQTFAEMPLPQKSEIGHRGKAIQQLIDHLSP